MSKLMIEIPDDLKECIDNSTQRWAAQYVSAYNVTIAEAIRNGVPVEDNTQATCICDNDGNVGYPCFCPKQYGSKSNPETTGVEPLTCDNFIVSHI